MSRLSSKRTKDYYKRTQYSPISNTLWEAVQFSKKFDRRALDIGCGVFRDSKFLINCGYSVTAVDKNSEVKRYTKWTKYLPRGAFKLQVKDIMDFHFKSNFYDLINAQNFFSFLSKKDLKEIVRKVKKSLKPGGYFTGNFFGTKDTWAKEKVKGMSFYTIKEVKGILKGLEILKIDEKEEDSKAVDVEQKHWHIISFITQNSTSH